MKIHYFIPAILTLTLVSCDKKNENQLESSSTSVEVAPKYSSKVSGENIVNLDAQVAVDFLNGYIQYCNSDNENKDIVEYTQSSPLVTNNFKAEVKKIIEDAFAAEPEIGLGFDPLFDAQDYPDEGVELLDFNAETGYLMVKGKKWKDFRVAMKVIAQDGKTLVDGCGVVNIPEDKQAER